MPIRNTSLSSYVFLASLVDDDYYPAAAVKRGQAILIRLCEQIEAHPPVDDDALLALTHRATNAFNDLESDFADQGGEIDTVARECIAADFEAIVSAYGFHLDIEEVIASRDW